ncbi:MAG: NAD(P)/FAD-dependent oxidoreductase [Ignavibacteriae bacterium]|nr:NAD(P)/FAD-dependent oxidoreductase [Ignavibacteriota bacterium]
MKLKNPDNLRIGIIGGGAAGFFAAVEIASIKTGCSVVILEKSDKLLSKVKISGGGRCNVTNACFDINELVKNYPRGSKELKSVFHRFSPADTINWYESKGVKLKTERDNRVFPESNNSETIINCFLSQSKKYNIEIIKNYPVKEIEKTEKGFLLNPFSKFAIEFDKIIFAQGGNSNPDFYKLVVNLGHSIVPPVSSLFTFNIDHHPLKGLEGISVDDAEIKLKDSKISEKGAILITHQGFSGPAILKLSAFGARIMNERKYNFTININWLPHIKNINSELQKLKSVNKNKKISAHSQFGLPFRLWQRFTELAKINEDLKWTEASKEKLYSLSEILVNCVFGITGKNIFKEEFVTAGGINLKEIDFKTMESKICKGLYFAGEVLDIDGITGGFNFQSAWSTAFIAARNISI